MCQKDLQNRSVVLVVRREGVEKLTALMVLTKQCFGRRVSCVVLWVELVWTRSHLLCERRVLGVWLVPEFVMPCV